MFIICNKLESLFLVYISFNLLKTESKWFIPVIVGSSSLTKI